MNLHDVLKKPLITEKSTQLRTHRQYVFVVDKRANKIMVKKAVESIFKVEVAEVNIFVKKGKIKKGKLAKKQVVGISPSFKKAIVKLKKDGKITELEA